MRPLLFPDHPTYWFETVRSMSHIAYGGADFAEVLDTAGKITGGDPDSWHDAWRETADRIAGDARAAERGGHRVSARDAWLRAWNYYRNAEFFLHGDPGDPRILDNYDRSVAAFRRHADLAGPGAPRPVRVPFEDAELPGYLYPSPLPGRRPLLLMHSGYDGSAEELHVQGAVAAQERGYHVLTFDGPGQPGTRHHQGLHFRPDWETVVGAVLDWAAVHVPDADPDRIGLLGVSLGGELCVRAAAFERRLAAVIAVDGLYDFGATLTAHFPVSDPEALAALLRDPGPAAEIDEALERAADASDTARWGLGHGQYVMGGGSPRGFLLRALDYHLRDGVAESVTCPVLICEAEDDLFFPGQPDAVFDHLTAEDRTLMRFTAAEGAGAHCHAGAQRYALARIIGWLDDRLAPARETAAAA
ncbi:alpha/beta hydrolase family protein [Streptomyces sp. NPDC101249]|uniref:alpha/beta hydrolase family protein n=1 Tax=Streptomyces sp. NPDC101249 TaxID=3366140 RepID=UPI00382718CB